EVRVERAIPHPRWTGRVEGGFDVVLLRLPREVHVQMPSLPRPGSPGLYPNFMVHALRLDDRLETAQLQVIDSKLCPELPPLGKGQFCAYSSGATMTPGTSGGPLLTYNQQTEAGELGVVVGIVSYANFSALDKSGVGCLLVRDVVDWIEDIIYHKVAVKVTSAVPDLVSVLL
ncbi:unnamed protein product, partial [Ostreobium quekettii]